MKFDCSRIAVLIGRGGRRGGRARWGHLESVLPANPNARGLRGDKPVDAVLSDVWPSERWEKSLLFKHFAAAAKSLQSYRLYATPQTAAHQAAPSPGSSRQEHWSGLPLPSPSSRWCLVCVWVPQLHLTRTLCDPTDCSPPGSSVHGILQARTLERVAFPFSRGSSWPRCRTPVSRIAGGFLTVWATREAHLVW